MKKTFSSLIILLFPFVLFSMQENSNDTQTTNGDNTYFQTFGNGENNLVFLFTKNSEDERKQNEIIENLKNKTKNITQNIKIFTYMGNKKSCWLRNFSESHQPSLYYYTKKINCGEKPETLESTKIVVNFFNDNKTDFTKKRTFVFLVRNDIKDIYISNYSSQVQYCISSLNKHGITNIYPEIHVGGTLSLWLEKKHNIPMITIPYDLLNKLEADFYLEIFKNDFFKGLFQRDKSRDVFFEELLLQTLPAECKNVKNNKGNFFNLLEKALIDSELLLLPNKMHSLDKNYVPNDMESLDGKNLSPKRGLKIRKNTLNALLEMKKDAKLQDCNLQVISAFRSYNTQQNVFMHWVKEFGLAEAQRISARPGTSQHQLGTAIDFNFLDESFEDYPEGKWLAMNAYKYGFILSFPKGMEYFTGYKYEPWHYRYVGKETALLIKEYFNNNLELFLQWYWKLWQPLD